MAVGEENEASSNNYEDDDNKTDWFVPACGFADFCCCPKGKDDTVCLHTHECPYRPRQPLRKCFPICTTDEVKPIYTPCLKRIIESGNEEEEIEEEEKSFIESDKDFELNVSDIQMKKRKVQIAGSLDEGEIIKETSLTPITVKIISKPATSSEKGVVEEEKLSKHKFRRVCMADEERPKVTCSCGSPTCQKCRKTSFHFVTDEEGNEIICDPFCEDILECNCGLHHCIRCKTKKQLQEQLKKRVCRCNLPECVECKWYSICEICAAPPPSKSKYYNRRKYLMQNKDEFPTISEVKTESGKDLSQLIFNECVTSLRGKMGLESSMSGPGDTLWQSPSDLLEGKVILKPPFTDRCIKALTHEGILKIGAVIEQKFMNEMDIEKRMALKEQKEMMEYLAEIEKQKAIDETRKEERRLCEEKMEELNAKWEEALQLELEMLEERLTAEYNQLLEEQREELEQLWQVKLEEAVAETTEKLTALFMEDLRRQEEELTKKFEHEMKKLEIKSKVEKRIEREKYEEKLKQMKHELECKNIANLMYVLCVERRKCMAEKEVLIKECENRFKDQYNEEMEMKIVQLEEALKEKEKQLDLREEYLREIIRQYQKFINFALKSSPTQAEFLLSLEKMLLFELTKQIAKRDSKLIEKFQPWKEDSEESVKGHKGRKTLFETDYHACFKEMEPPETDTVPENHELPHFYYNDSLYVREDFRNLLSSDRKVDSSYELWSRDVQDLINIMKGTIKKNVSSRDVIEERGSIVSRDLMKSSVYFVGTEVFSNSFSSDVQVKSNETEFKTQTKRKASLKITSNVGPINYLALQKQSEQQQLLIGAVNSLEIIKKRISIKETATEEGEEEETKEYEEEVATTTIVESQEDVHASIVDTIPSDKRAMEQEKQVQNSEVVITTQNLPSTSAASVEKNRKEISRRTSHCSKKSQDSTEISAITDSLIIHRASFSKKAQEQGKPIMLITTTKGSPTKQKFKEYSDENEVQLRDNSKLSFAKDSLELARKQSSEIVDGLVSKALRSPKCHLSQDQVIKVGLDSNKDDDGKRSVRMSHIEVIKVHGKRQSSVIFTNDPHIIDDLPSVQSSDSPLMIYGKQEEERENFLTKPNQAKVVGDVNAKEHLQGNSEFTFTRADSLLKMFDGRPDLIRMFTAGSK